MSNDVLKSPDVKAFGEKLKDLLIKEEHVPGSENFVEWMMAKATPEDWNLMAIMDLLAGPERCEEWLSKVLLSTGRYTKEGDKLSPDWRNGNCPHCKKLENDTQTS